MFCIIYSIDLSFNNFVFFCIVVKLVSYFCTVNYRGSAGFGQDMIEGLCGRVGDQDVKDVQVSCVAVFT